MIYIARQLNYITQEEANQMQKDLIEISLMIKGFIRILDKSGQRLNWLSCEAATKPLATVA